MTKVDLSASLSTVTRTLAAPPPPPDAAVTSPTASAPDALTLGEGCSICLEPPLRPDDAARHAAVLKALADPHRLRMLSLIAAQPADEPLCACEIEAMFDLSQPTISHHLRVLREVGLISVTKRGLWHYYTLKRDSLSPLHRLLASLSAPSDLEA
ncbi:MAG: ArsR/SmtB family transcription factor [Chloroflexota bacterium]